MFWSSFAFLLLFSSVWANNTKGPRNCTLSPLGQGLTDNDQIEDAIKACGTGGTTTFLAGNFNITRPLLWHLNSSRVDLFGQLNFQPDIQFWLNATNTYRVVFIQSQASWFVITGTDFVVDAHQQGGIMGNGQPWWEHFTTVAKADGDGRPISLTIWNATRATIQDFHIQSPPFWCNAVADSTSVRYSGMLCNATNSNPAFFGTNIVPNTDGVNTYRSSDVELNHWDVTCGDDCLAIKGNSTNIVARNITCRGGNGIAFGSLGQYANLSDIVDNVVLEDILLTRINSSIQPNMQNGVYLKTWDGTVSGSPPTGGGGGGGFVKNIVTRNVQLDRVNLPIHLYQTNGGHSLDLQSRIKFSNISFFNWSGTSLGQTLVNFQCSGASGGCDDLTFSEFQVTPPAGQAARYICANVTDISGLPAPCNSTGLA
ncbi:pectin lyase fold/virulence factor [Mycena floridula]|nr:pectin lyase fold/virulence factor [Mycena floridula]